MRAAQKPQIMQGISNQSIIDTMRANNMHAAADDLERQLGQAQRGEVVQILHDRAQNKAMGKFFHDDGYSN